MTFSIRHKMFLGLMGVVITFVVMVNFILYYLLNNIANQEIVHGLENSVLAYQRFDEQRKELMFTQASSMAQTVHLKATLTIPDVDSETVYFAGVGLKDIANPDLLLIISESGELLSNINDKDTTQISLLSLPGVEAALNSGNFYGIWEFKQKYFRVAISPIVVAEQVVGLIVIGQRLDSSETLQLAKEIAGTQVLLSIKGKIYTTEAETIHQGGNKTDLKAIPLASQTGKITGHKQGVVFAEKTIAGELYFTATIAHENGLGNMLFYRSINSMTSSVDPVRIIILMVSGLTILIGSLLSFRMSSRISKPIIKLTDVANEYGKGNFDLKIQPQSKDEVGALTVAFNSMADDIKLNRQVLLQSIEAAEAASRAKSTFLATMSHEIRTPLNGVLGMTDLLTSTQLDSQQVRLVDIIKKSGQNLLDIISEILDFSKIEAGKLELNNSTFNLRELIENIGQIYANTVQKKDLEFVCNIGPDASLLVEGDEIRLRQVLTNLISNAIKFTEKGQIEMRVEVLEAEHSTAQLRFEVSDTGIGVAQDKLDSIFQSFTQADGSTTRKFGGTGLGLAISQQLVGLMNSVIQVYSEIGKGTRFYFDLTLPAMKLPDGDKYSDVSILVEKRILIVDDVATNRDLLQQQLKSWGIGSDKVASGQECLQAIRQAQADEKPYSIALLDYNMPDMDGLELAKAINRETAKQTIHLALLSCSSDRDTELMAKHAGISTYLLKPVRQSELYNALVSMVANEFKQIPDKSTESHSALNKQLSAEKINARVLVVEDTLVNQEVVSAMLDWFGYQFVVVSDGDQAVKIFKKQSFDAILMDCQMPVMDGFDATLHIRKFEKSRGIPPLPIIALTANAIEGDRERCIESGMNDYLAKPFNQHQLRAVLLKWLSQKDSRVLEENNSAPIKQSVTDSNLNPPITKASVINNDFANKTTNRKIVDSIELIEQEVILDTTVLDQFRQLQQAGREGFIERLIKAFLTDSPTHLQNIFSAVENIDPVALSKAAHALKSSSANMGAKQLTAACKALEAIGRSGTIEDADLLVQLLQPTYDKTCDCLMAQQVQEPL